MTGTTYLHELACFACGQEVGELPSDSERPPRLFHARTLVCGRCGGRFVVLSGEYRRAFPKADPIDKPQRGRPPKWQAELRREGMRRLSA